MHLVIQSNCITGLGLTKNNEIETLRPSQSRYESYKVVIVTGFLPSVNYREISNSPLPVNLFPLPGIPEFENLSKCASRDM